MDIEAAERGIHAVGSAQMLAKLWGGPGKGGSLDTGSEASRCGPQAAFGEPVGETVCLAV